MSRAGERVRGARAGIHRCRDVLSTYFFTAVASSSIQPRIVFTLRLSMDAPTRTSLRMRYITDPRPAAVMRKFDHVMLSGSVLSLELALPALGILQYRVQCTGMTV
eukprot:6623205-Pyramimonas_sp.AAC.1